MSSAKHTEAILNDIAAAQQYNYTSVPNLHVNRSKKPSLISALVQRYYIETCLYAVEKWEIVVTNIASIAIFFFLAKCLCTFFVISSESISGN